MILWRHGDRNWLTLDQYELAVEIQVRRTYLSSLAANIKYADHGAYGQDRQEYYKISTEVAQLNQRLVEVSHCPPQSN